MGIHAIFSLGIYIPIGTIIHHYILWFINALHTISSPLFNIMAVIRSLMGYAMYRGGGEGEIIME
jgi:hypothetical protein